MTSPVNQFFKWALVASALVFSLLVSSLHAIEPKLGLSCDLILSESPISIDEATYLAHEGLKRHAGHVRYDKYGLVIPDKSPVTKRKIAADLSELKERISEAGQNGQHVLFLSGSYDLVHKDHALFVAFAIDAYINHHNITREDLFVVATADGDDLLGVGKASKYIANGGQENFQRPVQRAEAFASSTHPRALDLATLPVDAVLMTPSPRELKDDLLLSREDFRKSADKILNALESRISNLLIRSQRNAEAYSQTIKDIKTIESPIRVMSRLIVQGQGQIIVDEFLSSKDVEAAKKSPVWNLSSWNFILYSYLTSEVENLEKFARVLNVADSDYLSVVSTMQNLTGVNVFLMPEKQKSVSTTDLLKTYGAEALVKAKQKYHND